MGTLHPHFIQSQTSIAEEKVFDLEAKYKNGSFAMKNYIYPQLQKAKKTLLKWQKKIT
jgi:hypothetical protein